MSKVWNPEQAKAIQLRGANMLVSAAAGAGKTAVLVERILRLIIEDRVDIDEILVVTFTNAAAGELRERLHQALIEALKTGEDSSYIERQIKRLHLANICTIHAFGLEVIKQYYYFLPLDPQFKIADAAENEILQKKVLNELMELWYESGEEAFLQLVLSLGESRGDQKLVQLILSLYRFMQTQPSPEAWLKQQVEEFGRAGEADSIWFQEGKRQIKDMLEGARFLLNEAYAYALAAEGLEGYLPTLSNDLEQVAGCEAALGQTWEMLGEVAAGMEFKNLRAAKNAEENDRKQVQDMRNRAKDLIKSVVQRLQTGDGQAALDLMNCARSMTKLGDLALEFSACFRMRKLENKTLDFDDLEHLALELLQRPEVAKGYQNKFRYLFVDEYQDSNAVQEAILNCIKRKDNLFLVGDIKQSIYRFRSAEPSLFLHKLQTYDSPESAKLNQLIHLNRNYRSTRQIIAGVNYLFHHLMSSSLGDVTYDDKARLFSPEAAQDGYPTELLLLHRKGAEVEEVSADLEEAWGEIEPLTDVQAEAMLAAKRIQKLLQEEIYDAALADSRKVRYRDIVILLRSVARQAEIWSEVFRRQGIPLQSSYSTGYTKSLEILLFLDLLRLLDNRQQDIPLISVLRSPIGRFTAEELAAVRLLTPKVSFYEALLVYLEQGADELAGKLQDFWRKVSEWQEKAKIMQLEELIWYLFHVTGYYHYVLAMPGGETRESNLKILLAKARKYRDNAPYGQGLSGFISYMEQIDAMHSLDGSAQVEESDDAVRLMSIHKSKGLEFPVVIVAGLGRRFNLKEARTDILLHKELGIGPRFFDYVRHGFRDTLARRVIAQRIREESLSEEMRIFYVACTRAKQRLILTGAVKNLGKSLERWNLPLHVFTLAQAGCALDWVGPAAVRHPQAFPEANFPQAKELFDSCWRVSAFTPLTLELGKLEQSRPSEPEADWKRFISPLMTQNSLAVQRLNWQYPHLAATLLPSKVSVSELKESGDFYAEVFTAEAAALEVPAFRSGQHKVSPLMRGSAVHMVLAALDLTQVYDLKAIDNQITAMVEREILTPEEAEAVSRKQIMDFFRSDLGKRLLKARMVKRETSFNLQLSASQILPDYPNQEDKIIVQGVIDLYFEEPGGIVLVDYKTDYLQGNITDILLERYTVQMSLYAKALTLLQKKPLKGKYFYALTHRTAVEVI